MLMEVSHVNLGRLEGATALMDSSKLSHFLFGGDGLEKAAAEVVSGGVYR